MDSMHIHTYICPLLLVCSNDRSFVRSSLILLVFVVVCIFVCLCFRIVSELCIKSKTVRRLLCVCVYMYVYVYVCVCV